MGKVSATELARRQELQQLAKHLLDQSGRTELDKEEMRRRILAEFTKKLDGKLKNLQEGEGLAVLFEIDIIGKSGVIRGGSGSQRNMPEYIKWRTAVFQRDKYTCQGCGAKGQIQAHHKKAWSSYPELRFDIDNGITLCPDCHSAEHPHLRLMQ